MAPDHPGRPRHQRAIGAIIAAPDVVLDDCPVLPLQLIQSLYRSSLRRLISQRVWNPRNCSDCPLTEDSLAAQ